ncbi:uncharacterized protein LOC120092709 isoform X2 [Benincasa hispida]|uniref:uncharacterized protein LOC120092709 isoform X2 n=1 Tax=Benincasa hispida TaxID=102211 RepID=UPI001900973F|nr:uncharacterized protein LOC120092709 isoform X2 [Benincasa hispida]
MATIFSIQSHSSLRTSLNPIRPNLPLRISRIRCQGNNPATDSPKNQESKPENAVLKVAWYGSELLGIAASFLRPPSDVETPLRAQELARDVSGAIHRPLIVETIKEDFGRSYFVTGNLTLEAYEEQCEFADPAGSFKGLRRFKRNCTNFGSLVDKSNMKLTKWEDFELFGLSTGQGHWTLEVQLYLVVSLETNSICNWIYRVLF